MAKAKKRTAKRAIPSMRLGGHKTLVLKNPIARIVVVGVGGAGGNIVSRMMEGDRMRGVEYVAVNTDAQDLDRTSAHKKVYIGRALTRGLGAGMNPEVGKQAAEENRSEIGEILEGADVVFITAGMGGGTGTFGASVVADIAKEKGILTIAMVTRPFTFEGSQRGHIAQDGLNHLKEKVDSLIIVPNDKIFSIIDKDTPLLKAFGYIDEILRQGVFAITDLVNTPGIINVDFADIKTIMKDAGTTLIGIGFGSGPERAQKAIEQAIHSPLLEISIDGAKGVLFSIAGGKDMKMSEIDEVAKAVTANLDPNAKIIFGAYHDRSLKDKNIKVTVIATGFTSVMGGGTRILNAPTLFFDEEKSHMPAIRYGGEAEKPRIETKKKVEPEDSEEEEEDDKKLPFDSQEPWEIPAFLRKKKK
jgi:cell division protein FtsZ